MLTHGLNGFDGSRWSTGSWFGTRGRYRYRVLFLRHELGSLRQSVRVAPLFILGLRRLRHYG